MNQKAFRLPLYGWLLGVFCIVISVNAQVYSPFIVGYINLAFLPGDNLIASQLSNGDDTLNTIFSRPTPEGTTFTEWDPTADHYLPVSTYDTNSGWSINYQLTFGEGGLLHAVSPFTNTFVGSVWSGFTVNGPFQPPVVTGAGTFLLSCYVPFDQATFFDVVGRNPVNGESVTTLNSLTQISATTTFNNGTWNNGAPALAVGQSAFFNLVAVPEPGVLTILVAGALISPVWFRRKQTANQQ